MLYKSILFHCCCQGPSAPQVLKDKQKSGRPSHHFCPVAGMMGRNGQVQVSQIDHLSWLFGLTTVKLLFVLCSLEVSDSVHLHSKKGGKRLSCTSWRGKYHIGSIQLSQEFKVELITVPNMRQVSNKMEFSRVLSHSRVLKT